MDTTGVDEHGGLYIRILLAKVVISRRAHGRGAEAVRMQFVSSTVAKGKPSVLATSARQQADHE